MAKHLSSRTSRAAAAPSPVRHMTPGAAMPLPAPDLSSHHSLEACLMTRRSSRDFSSQPVSLPAVAQLLWAAQGVTGLGGLRTAPSAGALYPLRTYLVAGAVEGVEPGVYRYEPDGHAMKAVTAGDRRERLVLAALGQECAANGAAVIVFAAHYGLARREFGDDCVRLALMEAGHAAQNLALQATALDLAVIGLGKFDKDLLRESLGLPEKEEPLYLLVIGRKLTV